jgi:hypothetical protein
MEAAFWPAGGVIATLYLAVIVYVFSLAQKISDGDRLLHDRCKATEDALATHREQVARDYATRGDVKMTEDRIDGRLGRIEQKLDALSETLRR